MRRAVLVLSATVLGVLALAASASALPEVGRCVAQPGTGKYKDAACTEKAGAKVAEKQFEWHKGAPLRHIAGSGGEAAAETASHNNIICLHSQETGELHEALGAIKEVHGVQLRFTGCLTPLGGCHSPGAPEGEFVSALLKGPLGYISGKGTKAPVTGVELTPEVAGGALMEVECGGGAVKLRIGKKGSGACVIGNLGPADVMSTSFAQAFTGKEGIQSPQSFEGSSKVCNLEVSVNKGAWEHVSLAFSLTLATEEALEIKA